MSAQRSPWSGTTPVTSLTTSDGVVTLVEGPTFCLSGRTGDVAPDHAHGLFVLDTRVLSCWQLRLNGRHRGHVEGTAGDRQRSVLGGRRGRRRT